MKFKLNLKIFEMEAFVTLRINTIGYSDFMSYEMEEMFAKYKSYIMLMTECRYTNQVSFLISADRCGRTVCFCSQNKMLWYI